MSFYSQIMGSVKEDDIYIKNLNIENWYNPVKRARRFETTLKLCRNSDLYDGRSYLDPPENMTDEWYQKMMDKEYKKYNGMNQNDFLKELNLLADSKDTGDNMLFRAIIHAYYSKDLSDWPHKREGDIITEGIKKDDCVLLVDNHGQSKLDNFIRKMMKIPQSPQEIYILNNSQLYEVGLDGHDILDTYELHTSKKNVSELDVGAIIFSICSCPSIKNIDKYLKEILLIINTDTVHDIALKAPRFVLDPKIVFEAYPITLYGTIQYGGIIDGKTQNLKQICTPS